MQTVTCSACGYEFDRPALTEAGPACPRCGEILGPPGTWTAGPGAEVYLSAALGGSILGLLVAAILFITRS